MTNLTEIQQLPEMPDIWQKTLNWQPTAIQNDKFQLFYQLILEANQKLNLTRITEPEEFWEKHLWDSLVGVIADLELFTTMQAKAQIIDIGTGGGFPGIPLAILATNSRFNLVDSTRKKLNFIDNILTPLGLNNIKTIAARAEEIGQQPHHRQRYDMALIRAVANASVCAEYTLPLLKQGGVAVLYRGSWTEEETLSLKKAAGELGGKIENIKQWQTPLSQSDRHCLYLRKVTPTPPTFPRGVGIPTQKPL
jgi:16S rRNA (guanine527-N7)-methyltransferase